MSQFQHSLIDILMIQSKKVTSMQSKYNVFFKVKQGRFRNIQQIICNFLVNDGVLHSRLLYKQIEKKKTQRSI